MTKKHVIVRGRSVAVEQSGSATHAAMVGISRGALVVELDPDRVGTAIPFVARLAGEELVGYGSDPIEALLDLVEVVLRTMRSDEPMSMVDIMNSILEEI